MLAYFELYAYYFSPNIAPYNGHSLDNFNIA